MERITYCMVCGADAPKDADRCPACDAPLHTEQQITLPDMRRRRKFPVMWLLVALALAAILVLIWVLKSTGAEERTSRSRAAEPERLAEASATTLATPGVIDEAGRDLPVAKSKATARGYVRIPAVPSAEAPTEDLSLTEVAGDASILVAGFVRNADTKGRVLLEAWVHGERVDRCFALRPPFEFELVVPERSAVDIMASQPGRVAFATGVHSGTQDLELQLEAGSGECSLTIHVTDPAGGKIEGAICRAQGTALRTNGEGEARLTGLHDWWCTVTVYPPRSRDDLDPSPDCHCRPQAQTLLICLPKRLAIAGTVFHQNGERAFDAIVGIREENRLICHTRTDTSGRFVLDLPDGSSGPWNLEVTFGPYNETAVVQGVRSGDRDLAIHLHRSP